MFEEIRQFLKIACFLIKGFVLESGDFFGSLEIEVLCETAMKKTLFLYHMTHAINSWMLLLAKMTKKTTGSGRKMMACLLLYRQ